MDLRKQKTRRAIREAFLLLRRNNDLPHISTKELIRLAQISKASFYLHYRDIYDLSEQLQREAIGDIIRQMDDPGTVLHDFCGFMVQIGTLIEQFHPIISVLFSGSQQVFFSIHLEEQLKAYLFEKYPQLEKDDTFNVLLSYRIQGAYRAYSQHVKSVGHRRVMEIIAQHHNDILPFRQPATE